MRQMLSESIRVYLRRFDSVSQEVKEIDDPTAVYALTDGLRGGAFKSKFLRDKPYNLDACRKLAPGYIREEEYTEV